LVQTLKGLAAGTISEQPQPTADHVPHAPKIFTDTCRIEWHQPTNTVYNLVRGLAPYPGAFTLLEGKTLKILKAAKSLEDHQHTPGTHHTDHKTFLRFAAIDGYIDVHELQLEGKRKMQVSEFLRGYRFKN
jgi:methionyl-tRNA formyltransferase